MTTFVRINKAESALTADEIENRGRKDFQKSDESTDESKEGTLG